MELYLFKTLVSRKKRITLVSDRLLHQLCTTAHLQDDRRNQDLPKTSITYTVKLTTKESAILVFLDSENYIEYNYATRACERKTSHDYNRRLQLTRHQIVARKQKVQTVGLRE